MSRPYSVSHARIKPVVNDPNNPVSAAWDMVQDVAGVLSDMGGGGVDGDIIGRPISGSNLVGNFLQFDGTTQVVDFGSDIIGTGDVSISTWLEAESAGGGGNGKIINNGKFSIATTSTDIRVTSTSAGDTVNATFPSYIGSTTHIGITRASDGTAEIFINGQLFVSGDSGTPVAASTNLYMGNLAAMNRGIDSRLIGTMEIHPRIMDASYFAAEYARSRLALWKSGPVATTGNVTGAGSFIGDSPWRVDTGTHKIDTKTVGTDSVSAISCIANGQFYFPASLTQQSRKENAYGGWESVLNLSLSANIQYLFISSVIGSGTATGQDGYMLIFNTTGLVILYRLDAGALTELGRSTSVITSNVPFALEVIRSSAGLMDVCVDGAVVVSETDNTYTVSLYQNWLIKNTDWVSIGSPSGKYSVVKRLIG